MTIGALALAAVLASAPAAATSAGDAPAKEVPVAVQVARELLTPELWSRTLDGIVTQLAGQLRGMAEQNGGTVDAGIEPELRRMYDGMMPYAEVIDMQAGLLQKYFTDPELVQLRDFYRTPLGKKVRDRMPELQQDALGYALQKVQSAGFGESLRAHVHMPGDGADAPGEKQPADWTFWRA